MNIFLNLLILAASIGVTIVAANALVDGASALAKRFGISDLIIGLTIVAFGTSSPELAVNINAAIAKDTAIAIGNVLGSNIFNVFVILGVAAVIYPVSIQSNSVWIEIPLTLLAALMLAVAANDVYFDGDAKNVITATDSLAFLGFFAVFMYYTVYMAKAGNNEATDSYGTEIAKGMNTKKPMPVAVSLLWIAGGFLGLYLGSEYMIEAAKSIAKIAGLSDVVIGLTIVAAGTSMPELATSAAAAYKKNSDIAIGNVVGSNIFNIFLILGISGLFSPLPFTSPTAFVDIMMTIFASIIMFVFAFTGRRRNVISRIEGSILIVIYVIYVTYLISAVA